MAWQSGANAAVKGLRVLIFLVLARLLSPANFGLVAFASIFITTAWVVAGFGLIQAIIRAKDLAADEVTAIFWSCAAIGLGCTALLAVVAAPVAALVHLPGLTGVLLALSPMPLIGALSVVPEGLTSRNLLFKSLAVRHLTATSVSSVGALVLAFAGAGVWALVFQTLAEAVLSGVMLWVGIRRLRVRIGAPRFAGVRSHVAFGARYTGTDLLQALSSQADNFLIGVFRGEVAVGVYSVAYRLLTTLQDVFIMSASYVITPTIARRDRDGVETASAFARALVAMLATAGMVFAFVVGASSAVVLVALGRQWTAAAPIMAWLAVAGIAACVNQTALSALTGHGRAKALLRVNLVVTGTHLVAFFFAAQAGALAVAVAFAVINLVQMPVSLALAERVMPGALRHLGEARAVVPLLLAPVVLGLVVDLVVVPRTGNVLLLAGSLAAAALLAAVVVATGLRRAAPQAYRDVAGVVGSATSRLRRIPPFRPRTQGV